MDVVASFLWGHKVNARSILMGPVNEHVSAILARAFHENKFLAGAGSFTSLVSLYQCGIHLSIDVSIIKDEITHWAEVMEIISFEWQEPAVEKAAISHATNGFADAGVFMG